MPSMAALAGYTAQVFVNNDWDHLLASTPLQNCQAAPVAIPTRLGCPSTIKHVFLIIRENRTYDQDFGDIGKGNSDPALRPVRRDDHPERTRPGQRLRAVRQLLRRGHAVGGRAQLAGAGRRERLHREGVRRLLPQLPGAGRRRPRLPAGRVPLERGRGRRPDGQGLRRVQQLPQPAGPVPSWSEYYQDSQILEGKATGPLPVPPSQVDGPTPTSRRSTRSTDHAYPAFDLGIPDQYRTDIWLQSFRTSEKTGQLPNLNLIWMPDDHTAGIGTGDPNPVAEVADNDLAVGRIIDTISHSKFWKSSVVFVVEDDTQNGIDHVDGHRAPLMIASPYAQRGRRRQHLLHPAQRGEDDRADPRHRPDEPGRPGGLADVQRLHQQAQLHSLQRRAQPDPADTGPDASAGVGD